MISIFPVQLMPTLVNAAAVVVGSFMGLTVLRRLPERFRVLIFQTLGLLTLLIGMRDALESRDIAVLALSMLAGAMTGELLNIEERLSRVGERIKAAFGTQGDRFIRGFTDASILFCVGGMTLIGTLQAGVASDGTLLYTKSLLDGHASMFLAGTLGIGVLFSSVTIIVLQGGLTLFFMQAGNILSESVITELTAAGGLLIVSIGLNLLGIVQIRSGNLLPALLYVFLLHPYLF